MVGNFREGFIFAFFASQEPFAKIKTAKIFRPRASERQSLAYLELSQQNRVSEFAFDGYH